MCSHLLDFCWKQGNFSGTSGQNWEGMIWPWSWVKPTCTYVFWNWDLISTKPKQQKHRLYFIKWIGQWGKKWNIVAQLLNNWFQQIHTYYFRNSDKKQKRFTLPPPTDCLLAGCLTILYYSLCDACYVCCLTHVDMVLIMFAVYYEAYLLVKE